MNTAGKYVTQEKRERVFRALSVRPAGVTLEALRLEVGMAKTALAATLRVLRADKYADYLAAPRGGLWGTWRVISRLREKQVEESRRGRIDRYTAARRERRGAVDKEAQIMAVPDMPVRQQRVSTWAPPPAAPGPRSVFEWGQHA